MKRTLFLCATLIAILLDLSTTGVQAQSRVQHLFPQGVTTYSNIPYAGDTLQRHLLDIYLPPNAGAKNALVVWIHGGAWMLNDKYSDMNYMAATIKGFMDSGYALASIDYRYSTEAIFPAQIIDCNRAIEFLYQNAAKYKLDRNRIALIGFSAGGHLASLIGLSHNNGISAFYPNNSQPNFKIKCVLDFYGPSDFVALGAATDTAVNNERNSVSLLLGAMALRRPDLARRASPSTYVDKNDPPFFIVQGEKDESVPYTQSVLLSSWLNVAGVENQLIVVPNAPHYGPMFDAEMVRRPLFSFLAKHLR